MKSIKSCTRRSMSAQQSKNEVSTQFKTNIYLMWLNMLKFLVNPFPY